MRGGEVRGEEMKHDLFLLDCSRRRQVVVAVHK